MCVHLWESQSDRISCVSSYTSITMPSGMSTTKVLCHEMALGKSFHEEICTSVEHEIVSRFAVRCSVYAWSEQVYADSFVQCVDIFTTRWECGASLTVLLRVWEQVDSKCSGTQMLFPVEFSVSSHDDLINLIVYVLHWATRILIAVESHSSTNTLAFVCAGIV